MSDLVEALSQVSVASPGYSSDRDTQLLSQISHVCTLLADCGLPNVRDGGRTIEDMPEVTSYFFVAP